MSEEVEGLHCPHAVGEKGALGEKAKYRVEFYEDKAREHRWRFVSNANGNIMAVSSEGYSTFGNCARAYSAIERAIKEDNVEELGR